MAKKLHKIRVAEVSAVDKAANEDCVVVLRKRDGSGEQVVDLGWNPAAKRAYLEKLGPPFRPEIYGGTRPEDNAEDPPPHFRPERYAGSSLPKPKLPKESKKPKNSPAAMFASLMPARILRAGDLYKLMQKRAAEVQQEGETPEQAFARWMATQEGRELYEAYRSADPDEPEPEDEDVSGIVETSKAYDALMEKATKLAKRDGITQAQAFERVYTDPVNEGLVAMDKAYSDMSTGASLGPVQGRSLKPPVKASLAATDATPASAYDQLQAMAEKYAAEKGITVEAAFATISSQHPDLFATAKRFTVPVNETPAPIAKASGPSLDGLNQLRDELMAKNAGLTPEAAFERAMASPRGRVLYQRYRAELLG